MDKVGVLIVGVNGAVSSTLIAGVELMKRNLVPRFGMLTERMYAHLEDSVADAFDYVPLDQMVFAGWDPQFHNVYEAACFHKVLPLEQLNQVREQLESTCIWPAVFASDYVENISGDNCVKTKNFREEVNILIEQIKLFKREKKIDRFIMINLASTERYMEMHDAHETIAKFEQGLENNDPFISPVMRYFYVANILQIPYCNFTPSLTNIKALEEHALFHKNPYAGMDGKTGQTLLKTALAAMFRVRRLNIDGWYSTNILGNNDGLVLNSPQSNKSKIKTKASVLDSIVGYPVENHQVHIHYYKPRGDRKEAWDNIDIVGFAGVPIQIKVNLLGQDSVLAAPLLIDIIRFLDLAKSKGEYGIQRQLSLFFKAPFHTAGETSVHDLFRQEQLLLDWICKHCQTDSLKTPEIIEQVS